MPFVLTGSSGSHVRCDVRTTTARIVMRDTDGRQLEVPVVLPQEEMLPENFVCFGPKI
jgi:hypothetical protein